MFYPPAQCLECWTDVNCVTDAKIGNTLPLPRVELFGLITVTVMAETEACVHSERETLMLGSNFRSAWLGMEIAGVSRSRAAG